MISIYAHSLGYRLAAMGILLATWAWALSSTWHLVSQGGWVALALPALMLSFMIACTKAIMTKAFATCVVRVIKVEARGHMRLQGGSTGLS